MSRKLEEKQRKRLAEQARRARHQRQARRSNLVTIGIAVAVIALVTALIVRDRAGESVERAPAGVSAAQAGCGDVESFKSDGRQHVDAGTDVNYKTSPPTSGNHFDTPAEPNFYSSEVPAETLVHNLEHGQIVIWYKPDAPDETIDDIEALVESANDAVADGGLAPLLAAPFDDIADDYNFAITAWTHLQSCTRYSRDVIDAFRARFQGRGPEGVGVPPFTG